MSHLGVHGGFDLLEGGYAELLQNQLAWWKRVALS